MARIVFTTLGALLNLAQLVFPFWAWTTELKFVKGGPTFGGWDFLGYYLILVVYLVIIAIIYFISDICPPSWWFVSPKKRIYHTDLGVLWAEISERDDHSGTKEMTIWKQYWLFSKRIANVEYTDNRDLLISRAKTELDGFVLKREKEKKKSKNPAFDEWDGYIDKQSKRDDKLNGIGI